MGYIRIENIETGELELEVGIRPIWMSQDDYVCPNSGLGMSPKPEQRYVEYVKESINND